MTMEGKAFAWGTVLWGPKSGSPHTPFRESHIGVLNRVFPMGFLLLIATLLLPFSGSAEELPVPAHELPEGFCYVHELIPDVILDIRYAGTHNFVGDPIDGYEAPFAVLYSDRPSRHNTPVNIIIGALILKEMFGLTDEEIEPNRSPCER